MIPPNIGCLVTCQTALSQTGRRGPSLSALFLSNVLGFLLMHVECLSSVATQICVCMSAHVCLYAYVGMRERMLISAAVL